MNNNVKYIKRSFFITILLFTLLNYSNTISAQTCDCTPNTPFYVVDLTGNPSGTWTSSPPMVRAGSCCGSTPPDRCISFMVYLDSTAVAINFNIASGAVPGGSMYYQVDCSPPVAVGEPICVDGPGPYGITFCKPGSNLNTYSITSISEPQVSPGDTAAEGCTAYMYTWGLIPASITWNDITSGTGEYNAYLSATSGVASVSVTPLPGYPPYVDYQICGTPSSICVPPDPFCDTIRIHFVPPLLNSINPTPASYCANNPSGVWLNGIINGGAEPYIYTWTNGPNGSGTVVGNNVNYNATSPGTYSLTVRDATYPECPEKLNNVTVTVDPIPTVDAGSDKTVCPSNANVILSGSVTGATGGIWSGGGGFYIPSNAPNCVYIPNTTEKNNGSVTLTLTSTGNGACLPVSDQMTIKITPPLDVTINGPNILCYGETSTITANVTGGTTPYTYIWDTGETTETIYKNTAGTYRVTVTDATANPCFAVASISITENPELTVDLSGNDIISCDSITTITSSASGGAGIYSYLWNTNQTTSSIDVSPGTYIITVTDGVGCTDADTITIISANSTLSASITQPANLCNGTSTGITVNATGGFGGNTYLWNTNETTTSIVVPAGNYCVTVTDTGNCVTTACVGVLEDPLLIASISPPPVICVGSSTTVTASATGGQAPYTYLWNTGQTTNSITKTAGTYNVTITDSNINSCKSSASVTITQEAPLNIATNKTDVSCFAGSNGTATATPSGGLPGYSYLWTSGSTTSTATGLSAGSYTITITDTIGCTKTSTVNISEPQLLTVDITGSSNVSCYGGSNGSATATPADGTPPYSYLWSPGGNTNSTATGLSAGTYTVQTTDAEGCTATDNVTITQPTNISVSKTVANISCFGADDGSASLLVSGGTPIYTYTWSPSGSGSSSSGLSPATYTITVTDNNSCNSYTSFTITEPTLLSVSIPTSTNVNCFGENTGSAVSSATGGTSPYSYAWTPGGGNNYTGINLSAGTYTVEVTDDHGCTDTASVLITQNPLLTANIPNVSISCDSSVSLSVIAGGGYGSYSYLWTTGDTTSTASNLYTGTYIVFVTDSLGCMAEDTGKVFASNSVLEVTTNTPVYACYGSTATTTVNATGGLGYYTYVWNTGSTITSITVSKGMYNVTVTDSIGCIATAFSTVLEDSLIDINMPYDTICDGETTVIIPLISEGIPPYTYLWNTGETTDSIIKPGGTYTLTVTDSISCSNNASVTISLSPDMVPAINSVNIGCFGGGDGFATVNVSGGTPSYNYLWSNGSTDNYIYDLTPGNYFVTITDFYDCPVTDSVTITQPSAPLALTKSTTNVICYGENTGTADITVNGGSPPYDYLWYPISDTVTYIGNLYAGNYSFYASDTSACVVSTNITITQPNPLSSVFAVSNVSCYGGNDGYILAVPSGGTPSYFYSWSNGQTTQAISNLTAGSYTITVTDTNNCTKTYTLLISQPTLLNSTITDIVDVKCFGGNDGMATASVSGGVTPYSYQWTPGLITQATATNLTADDYTVIITDFMGCKDTAEVTITQPASAVSLNGIINNVSCFGYNDGSATVIPSGGVPPYTYSWIETGEDSATSDNLYAGTYHVYVSDANNCNISSTLTISQPDSLTLITGTIIDVKCFGESNGSASFLPSGGTPDFSYLWSNGQTTQNINDLSSGTYSVTVTDSYSCTATSSVFISQPTLLNSTITSVTDVKCFGENNGMATVSASGGIPPYSYQWTPDSIINDTATGLYAGDYTAFVTDFNGCEDSSEVTITQPDIVSLINGTLNNVSCYGYNDGSASVAAGGGILPYNYSWIETGDDSTTSSNLYAGTYHVYVSDSNNCMDSLTIIITQPDLLVIDSVTTTDIKCFGENSGSIAISVSGGSPAYTYLWSSGQTTQDLNNIPAGTYIITATDTHNCTETSTASISQPSQLNSAITDITNIKCFGENGGMAVVLASGGTPPYSYLWNPDSITNDTATELIAGSYTAVITDLMGCKDSSAATITQPSSPISLNGTTGNVSCYGYNDGSASVSAGGGTPPYTYSWLETGGDSTLSDNLYAGIYHAYVSDSNSCTDSIAFTISQPDSLIIDSVIITDVKCFGDSNGTIELSVSGGSPAYTYIWSNGQTTQDIDSLPADVYSITISDINGCIQTDSITISQSLTPLTVAVSGSDVICNGDSNGITYASVSGGTTPYSYLWDPTGSTDSTDAGLPADIYTVVITDAKGCVLNDSVTINQPTPLILNITDITEPACYGYSDGSASVSVSGGISGYSYSWIPSGQDSTTALNISAGNHIVTVTDSNGCIISDTIPIDQPSLVYPQINSTNISCYGLTDGYAAISTSGGSPGYTYTWSPNVSSDSTANNLSESIYYVTVTDTKNCFSDTAFTIIEPDSLVASIAFYKDVSCFGFNDGSATVSVTGGTPGFTYIWVPDEDTITSAIINGLTTGVHNVTVSDTNNCIATTTVTIAEPSPVIISASGLTPICFGASTTLNASATGGNGEPYSYLWNNGDSDQNPIVSPTSTTTYNVSVTDSLGCTGIPQDVIINVLPPLNIQAVISDDSICAGETIMITASATGGNGGPYDFSWSTGDSNIFIITNPIVTTSYTITATDNCSTPVTTTAVINVSPYPVADFAPINFCENTGNTFANISSISSGTIISYYWDFGDNTNSTQENPLHVYINNGTYNVLLYATSEYGCTDTILRPISVYNKPLADFTNTPACRNSITAFADASTFYSGDSIVSWLWIFGDDHDPISTEQNPTHISL